MQHLFRLLVAAACLWLAGCAHNVAYRTAPPSATPCQETGAQSCRSAVRHPLRAGADAAYITYVEFDDQGALHDRARTTQALAQLRERASRRPTLLLLFAHGWKHNARVGDANVRDFQALLVKLRANLAAQKDPRQVEGVYLSWRGLSARWEPAKELSFWRRKATAHRVGTDGAIEVIAELSAIRAQPLAGGKRHALVIAGHSFGGAVVYNATEHLLMRELVEAQQCIEPTRDPTGPRLKIVPFASADVVSLDGSSLPPQPCKRVPSSVADMVLLVNPAFENTRFDPLEARSRQALFAPGQMPVFAVFMSEKDWATRYFFPAGRFFSTLANDYTAGQRKRDTFALGHLEEKWTHTLDVPPRTRQLLGIRGLTSVKALGQIAAAIRPDFPGWDNYACGLSDRWSLDGVELARYRDNPNTPDPYSPYMVVRVKGKLIEDHNAIWGEAFNGFVENLVTARFIGGSEITCEQGQPARIPM